MLFCFSWARKFQKVNLSINILFIGCSSVGFSYYPVKGYFTDSSSVRRPWTLQPILFLEEFIFAVDLQKLQKTWLLGYVLSHLPVTIRDQVLSGRPFKLKSRQVQMSFSIVGSAFIIGDSFKESKILKMSVFFCKALKLEKIGKYSSFQYLCQITN